MPGWCNGCRRVRPVKVSGSGMAMIAANGFASGLCVDCELSPDDLLRESERRHGKNLELRIAWLRSHPGQHASTAVRRLWEGRPR